MADGISGVDRQQYLPTPVIILKISRFLKKYQNCDLNRDNNKNMT